MAGFPGGQAKPQMKSANLNTTHPSFQVGSRGYGYGAPPPGYGPPPPGPEGYGAPPPGYGAPPPGYGAPPPPGYGAPYGAAASSSAPGYGALGGLERVPSGSIPTGFGWGGQVEVGHWGGCSFVGVSCLICIFFRVPPTWRFSGRFPFETTKRDTPTPTFGWVQGNLAQWIIATACRPQQHFVAHVTSFEPRLVRANGGAGFSWIRWN